MSIGPYVGKFSDSIVPKKELIHLITSIGWAVAGIYSKTFLKGLGISLDDAILA